MVDSREIGLRRPGDHTGPRVHDFRHGFAIRTLLVWYRKGIDVERQLPVLSIYLGHAYVRDTYWYLSTWPELMGEAARRLDRRGRSSHDAGLKRRHAHRALLRLMRQHNVSANTIASYRDTFRLLFTFAPARLCKPPSALSLDDLDGSFSAFLADLETKRGASVRTRNLRLTAIRSFFRFVPFEEPAHSDLIQRVLAIPNKRHDSVKCSSCFGPRLRRSSPRPIARRGRDVAIMPCCCSRRRQACVSQN